MIGTKVCSKCKKELPKEKFYKSSKSKSGLRSDCKECHNEFLKLNRHKYIESRKKWIIDNKEKLLEQRRKRREYRRLHYPKYQWSYNTLSSHKNKGIKISISAKDLQDIISTINECQICGKLLDWNRGSGKSNLCSPTLDRIDNHNFIDKNNIMIICHQCNTTKNVRTLKEFILYCKMIYEKLGDKLNE